MYSTLPKTTVAKVIGKQILRSGTSVGAHYAESYRSKSHPDFVNKIEGAMQELEETLYWLDMIQDAEIISEPKLKPLRIEISELMSIFVTMVKHAKQRTAK
jgi:four helix bundle protein